MYKSVKRPRGAHAHPSHSIWDIVMGEDTRIGTANNMVYADKIVRLLNADAEKLGQADDVNFEGAVK